MRNVIVYHRGCPDGFGAAWWLRKMLLAKGDGTPSPVEVEMVSANWGDKVDEGWAGTHVWCVDFCFEAEKLRWLERWTHLDVIDHHQTSEKYIQDAGLAYYTDWRDYTADGLGGDLQRVAVLLDQHYSGVGLMARIAGPWSNGAMKPPMFVWNLEDRDLWKFERPETKNVFAAVTARPYTIEAWDELATMDHDALVAEGKGINLYRDQLIESVAASTFTLELGDDDHGRVWVPCASSPYFIGSDVAGLIAQRNQQRPIGAYCILHTDRVQIGLRSRDGYDVAALAEVHGGGGHKAASGLTLTWSQFMDRTYTKVDQRHFFSAAATDEHRQG